MSTSGKNNPVVFRGEKASTAAPYLQALTRSIVDAIVSADSGGRIIDWNPAAERILGYSRDDVLGERLDRIIPERFRAAHRAGLARAQRREPSTEDARTREVSALRKDGSEVPVELSISSWQHEGARFFTAIIRDISRRKRADSELRKYAERVEKQNQELQQKQVALMASRGALADSVREADTLFSRMADTLEGRVLSGRYRLERRLARGGFSVFYEATDLENGGGVAVKVLRSGAGRPSAGDMENFRREASLGLLVEHPNVIDVFAFDIDENGFPFLVMELLSGESLCQRLSRRTPSLREIIFWLKQIAAALGAAHRVGIVHCDISPANLFLSRKNRGDDRLVVVDFAVAKLNQDPKRASLSGAGIGSQQYLAPERLEGAASTAVDIYGLGVVAFELLAGRDPFPSGVDETGRGFAPTERARRLGDAAPDLPVDLCELVDEMLQHDPQMRPSAANVEKRLARSENHAAHALLDRLRRPSEALLRGCSAAILSLPPGSA